MKRILLIATGGTIASKQTQDGLAPSMDVNSLLSYIPDIKTVCKLDGISVMNVDSTNMTPALMKSIAKTVADNYGYYDAGNGWNYSFKEFKKTRQQHSGSYAYCKD